MDNLFGVYTSREWLLSGAILLGLGIAFLVFSRSVDKSGGSGKGKIAGSRAQRARSSGCLMLVLGILMVGVGICGMIGVFS
ncbi:MAG: hypothetical protein HFF04_01000 [Oscillospiraceae bacterium]|nr:hypothetical protein [Oscillospiraceae bacterium]